MFIQYKYYYNNRSLFILNSFSFTSFYNKDKLIDQTIRNILKTILYIIQIRRIKTTKMIVNNKRIYIKKQISIYEIVTIKLIMSKHQKQIYNRIYRIYIQNLDFFSIIDDPFGDPFKNVKFESTVTEIDIRNYDIHRRLCLIILDLNLKIFYNYVINKNLSTYIEKYLYERIDNDLTTF